MATLLKLIATPLGNINDISLRAIHSLKNADAIFAEDTRHSMKLITALGLTLKPNCRLISCDAHKEERRIEIVVEKLRANDNVMLITDAGSPTISDPGSLLVQGVIEAGLGVEVMPGPSAHVAGLMGAGVDTTRFAFLGFLPQKSSTKNQLIVDSARLGLALVIYESPLRINKLLALLYQLLGPRRVVVARELTKAFETFHRGMLGAELTPRFLEKGECVVIVEAHKTRAFTVEDCSAELSRLVMHLRASNKSTKDIVREASQSLGLKKSDVYDFVMNSPSTFARG